MTDKELLNDAIKDAGIKIVAIARKLNITREGFYKKLNNITEFKASEIYELQRILNLSNEQRDAIFFNNKVE